MGMRMKMWRKMYSTHVRLVNDDENKGDNVTDVTLVSDDCGYFVNTNGMKLPAHSIMPSPTDS